MAMHRLPPRRFCLRRPLTLPPLRGGSLPLPLSRERGFVHRFICGALALFLAIAAAGTTLAADAESRRLYDEALVLRHQGDFAGAIAKLETASRRAPDDVEVLLLLGTLYGFAERFDDAERVLGHARALAPGDNDVLLAVARIESYRKNFKGAERDVATVLEREPGNLDARALAGRLAYYQGALDPAEANFRAVLAANPDDLEGLLGLGDVLAARGDQAGAQQVYDHGHALYPDSQDVLTRLARLARGEAQPLPWRLDSLLSVSEFARRPVEPWYESFNQLTYNLDPATAVHGRVDVSLRFDNFDTYYETGVDHRFNPDLAGYLYAGATPHASFRERWTVLSGGSLRVAKGGDTVGGTVLLLDVKDSLYRTGFVYSANPGLQQYFLSGRLWLTARDINTWAAPGMQYLSGYLLRLDAQVTDSLLLYAGWADAPETDLNVTAEVRSTFTGLAWAQSRRLTWHLDYVHDDRQDSYIRHAVIFGPSLKF
jgi:YaiO family outer membrane protein